MPTEPALAHGIQLDEYTAWLQDALRRERAEARRLRRALELAAKSITRPLENVAPPAPGGRSYTTRIKETAASGLLAKQEQRQKPKETQDEDDEEVADFNAASPLTQTERLLLKHLHATPEGRLTSLQLFELLPRRSVYTAARMLARRGHITNQQALGDTRVRVYRLTMTGRLATGSLAETHS